MSLRNRILSDENIYNAIFAIESYISNPSLLDEEDIKAYINLRDRFDFAGIKDMTAKCKDKLKKILDEKEELFTVKVFFRLKKLDEEGVGKKKNKIIKYRPVHSASLLDQICMVCLLQPLMFVDKKCRKKTDLANKIPNNFYGYVPSESVDRIYQEWSDRFADYNRHIVQYSKRYRTSHEYRSEVSLDIKNFFPSVNPAYVAKYVVDTLSGTYVSKEDKETLHTAVAKLLYLKLEYDNVSQWENEYYGEAVDDKSIRLTRGIAQGLPQSYFFGNLCMVSVSEKIESPNLFEGESLYYVDDSVIYIKSNLSKLKFTDRIKNLNNELELEFKIEGNRDAYSAKVISDDYIRFHEKLEYNVSFHTDDEKSRICHIDETEWNLMGLPKEVSDAGIYRLMDEVDQNIALEKMESLERFISNYIAVHDNDYEALQGLDISEDEFSQIRSDKSESDKKILKRYRKLFLYQLKRLKYEKEGQISPKDVEAFKNTFMAAKDTFDDESIEKWFAIDEGGRFQAESRLLIRKLPFKEAKDIADCVGEIENRVSGVDQAKSKSLYQGKDAKGNLNMRAISEDKYKSLKQSMKLWYSDRTDTSIANRKKELIRFIELITEWIEKGNDNSDKNGMGLHQSMVFALRNSDEMKREMLNAYFSFISGFEITDDLVLVKKNGRPVDYSEFRILAMLRNKRFRFKGFRAYVEGIDVESLDNRMSIDYGLVGILGLIVSKVRKPEWVDKVIVTHRITKSFWQNGSKFLNSYTLHNEEHAITLIRKSVDLVNHIDYLDIKQVDWFILFIACYLHDISMVIHPDLYEINDSNQEAMTLISDTITKISEGKDKENDRIKKIKEDDEEARTNIYKETGNFMRDVFEQFFSYFENKIRNEHPQKSAQFIIDRKDTVFSYLDPVFLHMVAEVSRSHGEDIHLVYGLRSEAKSDSVSEKYMKMLIRLADLHDVANDRINYYLLRQNVEHMTPTSRFHWISHLVTDSIRLVPKYDLGYDIDEINGIRCFNQYINETLEFELTLNVRCLSPMDIGKCKRCSGVERVVREIDSDEDGGSITLELGGQDKCRLDSCPSICRWAIKKHEWLLAELNALSKYLNSVRQPMFRTKVKLKIVFKNELNLDKDLYDSVMEYLKKS